MANIKDFLNETEMYEYSQENYEMTRDLLSFALVERYLQNCEMAEQLKADGLLTESYSYFLEDENIVDKAAGAINSKIDSAKAKAVEVYNQQQSGLVGKIVKMIQWICKNILGFFNKADEVVAKMNAKSLTLLERLQATALTREDVTKLLGILKDGKGINYADMVTFNQPFKDKLNLKYAMDLNKDDEVKSMEWLMACVFSNETVLLTAAWGAKDCPRAVTQEEIIPIMNEFIKADSGDKLESIRTKLDNLSLANKKQLIISADTEANKKNANTIAELQNNVSKITPDRFGTDNAAQYEKAVNSIKLIRESVTQTIRVYDDYIKYRNAMINKITEFLNQHAGSTPVKKEGE